MLDTNNRYHYMVLQYAHTHTLLSGNDRKRLLNVTNCFRCCGELKCHKTVCLTHNAYSFECPSHTQSLCAIIVRHTWPDAISWIWSTSLQIEGGPHFTELIWINIICLIYGTGICSVYHMIQTILEYTYIEPILTKLAIKYLITAFRSPICQYWHDQVVPYAAIKFASDAFVHWPNISRLLGVFCEINFAKITPFVRHT